MSKFEYVCRDKRFTDKKEALRYAIENSAAVDVYYKNIGVDVIDIPLMQKSERWRYELLCDDVYSG